MTSKKKAYHNSLFKTIYQGNVTRSKNRNNRTKSENDSRLGI